MADIRRQGSRLVVLLGAVLGGFGALAAAWQLAAGIDAVGQPTASALPRPVLGETVNLTRLSGSVTVRVRPQSEFVRLGGQRQVPLGTVVDTRQGRVKVVSSRAQGGTQPARVSQGIFEVRQSDTGLTTLRLRGGPTVAQCKAGAAAASLKKKLKARARGNYRTWSSGVANTVRGTIWKMTDNCGRVTTDLFDGEVVVNNFVRRRRAVLRCTRTRRGRGNKRRLLSCVRFRTRGRYSAATVRGG